MYWATDGNGPFVLKNIFQSFVNSLQQPPPNYFAIHSNIALSLQSSLIIWRRLVVLGSRTLVVNFVSVFLLLHNRSEEACYSPSGSIEEILCFSSSHWFKRRKFTKKTTQIIFIWKGLCPSFEQTWITFTQWWFVPSLGFGIMVLSA